MSRRIGLVVAFVVAAASLVAVPPAGAATYPAPPEDYAEYQPQTACAKRTKPGTRLLAGWIDREFAGGSAIADLRACGPGTSEHKDGRAIDWAMSARSPEERAEVARFLEVLFAPDELGEPHALARRMGLMYVIWNDHIYAAYNHFEPRKYRSSSCRKRMLRKCSATLRHRDHVHISLSRSGAKAMSSWYAAPITDA